MIRLAETDYQKLAEPLRNVTINHLFARSVVEKHVTGTVYADDRDNPKTFYIVHPYGMTLLLGDHNNEKFNAAFRDYALNRAGTRDRHEWMQAFPDHWHSVLDDLFRTYLIRSVDNRERRETGIIELNTRVNFKFQRAQYHDYVKEMESEYRIARTDKKLFAEMKGSVVPSYFWDSADDFIKKGVGFSLFYQERLASTAYSSYIHNDQLELGIETVAQFRGRGLARYSCAALINYCLAHNYEPIWACRLENTSSYRLALKLGFQPSSTLPYYRLSN